MTSISKALKIAVIGSVNLDLVITTETLPIKGETIANGTFETLPGGKGGNVAVTCQRLGADTALWACVGKDPYADQALEIAKREDVDLSNIIRLEATKTGVALINVSKSGENQIAVASGANMAFPETAIGQIDADAIICQFEIPQEVVLAAIKGSQAFICINCSPVGPALSPLLSHADLLIFNEGEFEHYKNQLGGFSGLVAITLGANGAKLFKAGREIALATPVNVTPIDTTGAGDSFAGAITFALAQDWEPAKALQFACNVGALTTTKLGAQIAVPALSEVQATL